MTTAQKTAEIYELEPSHGTPAGGFPIDIPGEYLANTTHVNWGSMKIMRDQLRVSRDGKLVTIQSAPKGTPDKVIRVSVTTSDAGTSNVRNFTYDPAR